MKHLVVIWQAFASLFTPQQMPEELPSEPPAITIEANETGRIPILEYHSIGPKEYRWTRSTENFKKDLEWLYNNDYVLLSIEDYAHNSYPIPAGKKPVILTFDDGKTNHFRYLEDDSIDPDCAVGILDQFYQEYPDFGSAAVFYLNRNPFGPVAEAGKKIRYLYETGRQIGYHTLDHNDLRYLSGESTLELLKAQKIALEEITPAGLTFTTMAYPHGWVPAQNESYIAPLVSVGLLVGADPAYPLYHEKANPYRTPRIQAINDEWLRHFGRQPGATGDQNDSEKFDVFVSDGVAEYTP